LLADPDAYGATAVNRTDAGLPRPRYARPPKGGIVSSSWLLLITLARAECPAEAVREAKDATAALEAAFARVEEAPFVEARQRLDEAVACIREPLTPADAATIHLGRALVAFFDGDNAGTARALTAVRVLQPGWTPPSAYMEVGTPLREIWNVTTADDTRVLAPGGPPGGWRIDGTVRSEVPAARSFVAQGVGSGGEILSTTWAARPSELAPWDAPAAIPEKPNRAVRYGGTALAVALVGVGAGTMAAAGGTDLSALPQDEVVRAARRANTMAGVGAGCGAAGLAVGVVAWTGRF
jgi:hypothetical protein